LPNHLAPPPRSVVSRVAAILSTFLSGGSHSVTDWARSTPGRGIWFGRNRAHRIITFESAKEELAEGRTSSGCPAPILPRSATAAGKAEAGSLRDSGRAT
jgi:hypothetical protein